MRTEAQKHCPGCREDWPADAEFFHVQSRRKDCLSERCKACSRRPAPTVAKHRLTDCLQGLLTGLLHQGAHT